MKYTFFFTLFIFSIKLYCQSLCEPDFKTFGTGNFVSSYYFKLSDGNYMTILNTSATFPDTRSIQIRKMDPLGNLLFQRDRVDTLNLNLNLAKQLNDGSVLISYSRNFMRNTIEKIDRNGNLLWEREDSNFVVSQVHEFSNGDLTSCGFSSINYSFRNGANKVLNLLSLLRINSNGVKLNFNVLDLSNELHSGLLAKKYATGVVPQAISIDQQNNIHLSVFASYSGNGYGDLHWLKYNSSLQLVDNFLLSSKVMYETHKMILNSNNLELWFHGYDKLYDGETKLFERCIFDTQAKKADWSNKIYCADKLQDMLIETDGSIVILGNNGFYRYDKNLELKSYSNFSVQGTRCHALAKSNFVKEKDNEFSFLAFDLDKMYQVTYKYFGHDCLTQMYGNVFIDVNKNCIRDTMDQKYDSKYIFVPTPCDYLQLDSLGNYNVTLGYGKSSYSLVYDKSIYDVSCGKNPDTIVIKYPLKIYAKDVPIFKKNPCFYLSEYAGFGSYAKAGGIVNSIYRVENKTDSTQYNFTLQVVQDSILKLINVDKQFVLAGDTLVFKIDSLRFSEFYTVNFLDSVSCGSAGINFINKSFYLSGKDRCVDTSFNYSKSIQSYLTHSDSSLIRTQITSNRIRPCSLSNLKLTLYNDAAVDIKNIEMKYEHPSLLNNIFVSHPYTFQANTWSFSIDSIVSGERKEIIIIDSVSCNAKIGDVYCHNLVVHEYNQCYDKIISKQRDVCFEIGNSYDPNYVEGHVNKIFDCYHKSHSDQIVDYRIHFQNTGNDTAYKVIVHDTLDSEIFDLKNVSFGNSSHSYRARIVDDSIIEFEFNQIFLPDSSIDQANSKAYVEFRIPIKITSYNIIQNRASIYFDNNAVVNTEFYRMAPCSFTLFVIDEEKNNTANNWILYPNPTSSMIFLSGDDLEDIQKIHLVDATGRIISRPSVKELKEGFSVLNFDSGLYYVSLISSKSMKLIKVFVSK